MKVLGWNCRDICRAATVRALKAQIKGTSPDVIFLSETKASTSKMVEVMNAIKFSNLCVVEAKGTAGGICVMWKVGYAIQQVEYNKNLIAVKISDANCVWLLVAFYEPPYPSKKKKAWENLMALLGAYQGPWVCIGDFNYTINVREIIRGRRGSNSSATNYLKELIFEFGAIDLGYFGNAFTWARGKWGSSAIKKRLDRGIASISWRLAFPKATVSHLGTIMSDHTPILLDTNPEDSFAHRPFRFEATWIRDNGYKEIIEKAWNEETHDQAFARLYKKQATTREDLRKWNKEVFGHCQVRIN